MSETSKWRVARDRKRMKKRERKWWSRRVEDRKNKERKGWVTQAKLCLVRIPPGSGKEEKGGLLEV